jgi:hypothetical protein
MLVLDGTLTLGRRERACFDEQYILSRRGKSLS